MADTPELYKEYVPEGETEAIRRFTPHNVGTLVKDYPGNNRPARRRLHAKAHGLVAAEFRVMEDVPKEFRHGVFSHARTFPALIRYSNGFRSIQHDKEKDARGMAIKLLGVEGEKMLEDEKYATTQDFTLLNNDVFFIRTAADFEGFSNAVDQGPPIGFFFGWNPFKWKLHEAMTLLKSISSKVRNPMAMQYWNTAACRLGPTLAVKLTAVPRPGNGFFVPDTDEPNFMYRAMAEQLKRGGVIYDFFVQVQTDPVKMPIEDPTISWSEALSPFRKVAEIHIPAQTFDSAKQMEFNENLSFNAWHTLPEHMPLGGINRMRKSVYRAISESRHRMNDVPRKEPTLDDLPESMREVLAQMEAVAG